MTDEEQAVMRLVIRLKPGAECVNDLEYEVLDEDGNPTTSTVTSEWTSWDWQQDAQEEREAAEE